METREDPHVNLRDTYLVGTRLSKFLSTVLPTHKDFHSTDPELAELRRQSHERWLSLSHYLEELALIIDEEEHNQFVLKDLNDTLDNTTGNGDEDDAPTADRMTLTSSSTSPPTTVLATTRQRKQPSPTQAAEATPSKPTPLKQPQNSNDLNDSWRAVADTQTVASLDTNWFSTGAFSDPFPGSDVAVDQNNKTNNHNYKSDNDTNTATDLSLLSDREEILHITGSTHRRSRLDHDNIDFATNMSLEDDCPSLDSFAKGLHSRSAAVSLSPSGNVTAGWKIAPFSSAKKPREQRVVTPESFNASRGTNNGKLGSDRRVSWKLDREDLTASPSTNVTDAMVSWWDTPVDESKMDDNMSSASSTNAQIDVPTRPSMVAESPLSPSTPLQQHAKVSSSNLKAAARRSSRYVALEEHEANQRRNSSRRKQTAPNVKFSLLDDQDEQLLPQHLASDVSRDMHDADLSRASNILDSNKAKAKQVQPYRHRGLHHFRECVRCLLE